MTSHDCDENFPPLRNFLRAPLHIFVSCFYPLSLFCNRIICDYSQSVFFPQKIFKCCETDDKFNFLQKGLHLIEVMELKDTGTGFQKWDRSEWNHGSP